MLLNNILNKITPSVIDLNFEPRKTPLPHGLSIVVNNYRVSRFDEKQGLFYEGDIGDFLQTLYPEMGLGSWSRLYKVVFNLASKEDLQREQLWKELTSQSTHLNEIGARRVLEVLSSLPRDFQDWVDDKKVSVTELHPFYLWYINGRPTKKMFPLLNRIINFNCSKQEGLMALEYALDLHLMGNISSFKISSLSKEAWLHELKCQRYPKIAEIDSSAKDRSTTAPWPKRMQTRPVRNGDTQGFEVKFQFNTQREFEAYINQLNENRAQLCQHLWPKN